MTCSSAVNSSLTRPTTHRFKEYLKPGALARLRDSKISTRSHHRYVLVTPLVNSDVATDNADLPPEFPSLNRGPYCFGRRKLVAARFVADNAAVDSFISSVVSANNNNNIINNNLLVH